MRELSLIQRVALLAAIVAGLAVIPGGASFRHAHGEGARATYHLCTLIQLPWDSFTRVPAPELPPIAGDGGATFLVTYSGFTAEAQAAFQRAVDIWKGLVASSQPIRITATFSALGANVLGSAGATCSFANFSGAPVLNTWYPNALADRLSGANQSGCSGSDLAGFEISASFSNGARWYYGTDGNPGAGQVDFVSVVLHEIGHGLGFAGLASVSSGVGTLGSSGRPAIYDRFAVTESGAALLTAFTNPSAALGTQLTHNYSSSNPRGPGVYFSGTHTNAANGGASARLYTVTPWSSGSSYSHVDESTYPAGSADSLMTYAIGSAEAIHHPGNVTLGMFKDMGWSTCPASLNATSATVGSGATGGSAAVTIESGCVWAASSHSAFLTITSGASGTGSGTVGFSVAANNTGSARQGTLRISGVTYTVTQSATSTVPGAPTSVTGVRGNGQVTVSFTAPLSNGGSAITGYTATASPGGASATGSGSPLVVTGLTNGTAYTFTVTATNGVGTGSASSASSPVIPTAPTITVNPSALTFAATKNGAAGTLTSVTGAQSVSVSFSAGAPTWTVSSNVSWLSLSASGGTGSGTFTASIVNPSNVIGASTSLTGTITVTLAGTSNSPRTIAVALSVDQSNGATTAVAVGGFDSPSHNATSVVGAVAVTGWALDDIGVERVEIWRNCLTPIDSNRAGVCRSATPTGAPDRVFIGTAAFVPGARTDIETNPIYAGYPQAYRAGWGYLLLTNALPNQSTGATEGGQGPITLYAYAIDREGRYTELGSKTVTLNNDNSTVPFGAIDTPEQGGTVTAAVSANFGWAMTRRRNASGVDVPKCIERTRYRVFVDGVARTLTTGGNWHPNLVRADLTAAYPGLCDSANSLAAYYLDVTALGLANGTHTIGWDVYDDNGTPGNTADDNVAGIGSRFFNILVGAADAPVEDRLRDRPARRGAASDLTALPATETRELRARVGAVEAPVVAVDGDPAGRHAVNLPQGSRLAVDLGGAVTRGYLVVGDELRDLPIGSTLDADGGQFYWQPAVPYFGAFEMVFVSATERGGEARTTLEVTMTDPTAGGEPEVTITSPRAGANPNPVITVTGTARDPRTVSGTGITTVHVWAYPDGAGCTRPGTACTTPVFLGEAALVNGAYRLVTAPLAPGTYDLAVFAWVARTGTWAPAAMVTIAVR